MTAKENKMANTEWYGCYRASWNAAPLTPDAYSHPAKVSFGLAERIYKHLLEQGYIEPGQTVVDPFGGIAGFAFHALMNGLHWTGIELEEKFVKLGNENIELWNGRYSAHFSGWGTARLLQGDSRFLAAVLGEAGCVVSSPPYAQSITDDKRPGGGIDLDKVKHERSKLGVNGQGKIAQTYGRSPGQLGGMKEGTPPAAIVSSPPYSDAVAGVGEGPGARFDPIFHKGENATKKSSQNGYGETAGQLGRMEVGAVIGSPPFENSLTADGRGAADMKIARDMAKKHKRIYTDRSFNPHDYGSTPGNIGNDIGATFWEASAVILSQCYEVLRPGGVCAFVTGNFRRNGQIVPFGEQWLALCESVGFVGLERITAWKVEPGPIQAGMFGDKDLTKERVSFFRRLDNQKNPGNEINCEEVWIVQKPLFANQQPEVEPV